MSYREDTRDRIGTSKVRTEIIRKLWEVLITDVLRKISIAQVTLTDYLERDTTLFLIIVFLKERKRRVISERTLVIFFILISGITKVVIAKRKIVTLLS